MPSSLNELLNKLQGTKPRKRTTIQTLRDRIFLHAIFSVYKTNPSELQDTLFNTGFEKSNIVAKWLRGEHSISKKSLNKLFLHYEDIQWIHKTPIFDLLENKPISGKKLESLLSPFLVSDPIKYFIFPSFPETVNPCPAPKITFASCSESLFERGDIYGFMGILYLVRKAEIDNDIEAHMLYMADAYRSFPAFCRNRYFRPYWKDIFHALTSLHSRVNISYILLTPKPDVIERQIHSESHITMRTQRPRCPVNNDFIKLELPFMFSQIIT